MSWDIELIGQIDGNDVFIAEWNYTHNCNEMIRHAGGDFWGMDSLNGMTAQNLYVKLLPVASKLYENSTFYRAMNPENGWGDYDSLLKVLDDILKTCWKFPSARVEASF